MISEARYGLRELRGDRFAPRALRLALLVNCGVYLHFAETKDSNCRQYARKNSQYATGFGRSIFDPQFSEWKTIASQ